VEEQRARRSNSPQAKGGPLAAEPVDNADACERVRVRGRYLRNENSYSPGPIFSAGLRWGIARRRCNAGRVHSGAAPTEVASP